MGERTLPTHPPWGFGLARLGGLHGEGLGRPMRQEPRKVGDGRRARQEGGLGRALDGLSPFFTKDDITSDISYLSRALFLRLFDVT